MAHRIRHWRVALALVAVASAAVALVRVSRIVVHPGGDYELGVTLAATPGVATLTTGAVTALHLADDADAAGHRITNVSRGTEPGDALMFGQPANSPDFMGTYPELYLTKPMLKGTATLTPQTINAGACTEASGAVMGAASGMVATASPPDVFGAGVAVAARVSAADTVRLRVCAIAAPVTLAFAVAVPVGVVQ